MFSHWLLIFELCIIGCLVTATIVWLVRHWLRQRRKAQVAAELAAMFRKEPPDETKSVSVDELVSRIAAEGRPVRLNWQEESKDEWPTAIMPKAEE